MSQSLDNPFRGSLVALPTPFRDQHIEFDSLRQLVELQAQGGTRGIIAAGSTGEGASLSTTERTSVVAFCVGAAARRIPVIAGVGASSTRTAVQLAEDAHHIGAAGLLVTSPIYVRPQQRGIVEHFCAVARATPLPVILYDIPRRTGVAIHPDTVTRVRERCPNVCAIKESAGVDEVLAMKATGIDVLCGEDSWIVEGIQAGAVGAISVVGNLVPKRMVRLLDCISSTPRDAADLLETLRPLITALSLETNPVPLKAMLAILGYCPAELRLPLVELEDANLARARSALQACGLL